MENESNRMITKLVAVEIFKVRLLSMVVDQGSPGDLANDDGVMRMGSV